MADRRWGHAQLFGSIIEALITGGGLETAQGIEWWQATDNDTPVTV